MMKRAVRTVLVMFIVLVWNMPVAAQENGDAVLEECLCVQTLSRVLCKPVSEFSFIGSKNRAYYYNVFYGSKHSNFLCRVRPQTSVSDLVLVSSRTWLRLERSLEYSYNATSHKMTASYYNPECPRPPMECSRRPRPEELEAQKEDAFWYRPIPKELLGVDQKGGSDNETAKDDLNLPDGLKPDLP